MVIFSSHKLGIQLHYPNNWIIHEVDDGLFIAENENHFPMQDDQHVYPDYLILQQPPYLSEEQKLLGAMSAAQVANTFQTLTPTDSTNIIEPITQVNIDGQDGAIKLGNSSICYNYSVFLSLGKDNTVILSSCGPEDSVEEMKSVLNAIALSIEPISD